MLHWPLRVRHTPPAVLAHRGGDGPHPENSLGAFAGALAAGADGVELDVRLSADGVPVVVHDPEVEGLGPVHELARAALPDRVPSLDEALAACAGALVDVEIKNSPGEPAHDPQEALAAQVAALLARLPAGGQAPAEVLVTSFWPPTVAAVRAAAPELATGLLVHPALEARAMVDQAAGLGCAVLLPFRSQVDPSLVEAAHGAGLGVVVWTVNEPDDLRAVVDAGVDGLVTDRVAAALAVLGRR